jgi:hypothetical protein
MNFIERVTELADMPEGKLVQAAFDELRALSLRDLRDVTRLSHIEHAFTVLAVALNWIERPRVITKVMSDGIQLRDSIS